MRAFIEEIRAFGLQKQQVRNLTQVRFNKDMCLRSKVCIKKDSKSENTVLMMNRPCFMFCSVFSLKSFGQRF